MVAEIFFSKWSVGLLKYFNSEYFVEKCMKNKMVKPEYDL